MFHSCQSRCPTINHISPSDRAAAASLTAVQGQPLRLGPIVGPATHQDRCDRAREHARTRTMVRRKGSGPGTLCRWRSRRGLQIAELEPSSA